MPHKTFGYHDIVVSIDISDDDPEFKARMRDALLHWMEENNLTISIMTLGDETSDVFLFHNGVELSSIILSDYEDVTIYDLKEDLFERFIENDLDKFEEIDEC